MAVPGELGAALFVGSALTATYLLFFGLPVLQHRKFRHELWAVRDALVDDIIDGRLSLSNEARELLLRLHLAISTLLTRPFGLASCPCCYFEGRRSRTSGGR